jgi:hypothetical protein
MTAEEYMKPVKRTKVREPKESKVVPWRIHLYWPKRQIKRWGLWVFRTKPTIDDERRR